MNSILMITALVIVFSFVLFLARTSGKSGIIAFACIASVLANIITSKQINVLGLDVSMGAVMFSSVYLCTDMISEIYGSKESKKTVFICLASILFLIGFSKFILLFVPNEYDFISESMRDVFSSSFRISLSSAVMFFISNMFDVYLFDKIKKKTNGNKLWLRNNVSTIISNCMENFFFIFFAFFGTYNAKDCLSIAISTSMIEIVISILDTPFVYIGRKMLMKYRKTRKDLI